MTYRAPVRKQEAVITVRCYADEKQTAKELAKRGRETVSDLVRRLLAQEVDGIRRKREKQK